MQVRCSACGLEERVCPACGTGRIVERTGVWGRFFGCSSYPRCEYKERGQAGLPDSGRLVYCVQGIGTAMPGLRKQPHLGESRLSNPVDEISLITTALPISLGKYCLDRDPVARVSSRSVSSTSIVPYREIKSPTCPGCAR